MSTAIGASTAHQTSQSTSFISSAFPRVFGHGPGTGVAGRRARHRDSACEAEFDAVERWASRLMYGPRDIVGGGGLGGFTANYFPLGGPGILMVSQNVAAEYKDTLIMSAGGVVTAHPDLPATAQLTALVMMANLILDPLTKIAFVSQFMWTDAEKRGSNSWHARLEQLIEDSWSGQHQFFLNQRLWNWIGSSVIVSLNIAARPRQATDHLYLETYKTPANESLRTYGISHQVRHGSVTSARDQSMRLASTTLGPKEYDLLKMHVLFPHNSAVLTTEAIQTLNRFIRRFDGAIGHRAHQEITVVLAAHTSSSGTEEYNVRLARRRARAVQEYLRDHGFHNIETRVSQDIRGESETDQIDPHRPEDRRVDLIVDGGERMVTAIHEFGHAFGLDDEYGVVGTTPEHDPMARAMTDASGRHLPGAVREHNAGVMSLGNEVRPRHYATFHHALETVTVKDPWSLGWPRPKSEVERQCDLPMGHYPVPRGDIRPA